ncbi:MAG TPA: hypothetical protein VN372_00920 [Methanospirillum sp.]|nr:hypothetical protein [Methanospirillum sp.]
MGEAIVYPSCSPDRIPWQLQRDDLLFVLIPRGEKGLQVKGWNKVCNGLKRYDSRLINHLQAGGNYGYFPSPGSSLLSIDVDHAEQFHQAGGAELVGATFRYSAWPDRQKYRAVVECPDIPDHFRGHKVSIKTGNYQTVVELFYPADEEKTGGQCVGPGSLHPNGNRYSVFEPDAHILSTKWSDIEHLVQTLSPDSIRSTIPEIVTIAREPGSGKTVTDRYRLSVMDNLPENPYLAGDEIRGVHPVHGSTSPGGNVSVNHSKGFAYCFRCSTGYDAAGWDAVCRGIINCGDRYDSEAVKRHVALLDEEKPEVKFLERIEWRRNLRARGEA